MEIDLVHLPPAPTLKEPSLPPDMTRILAGPKPNRQRAHGGGKSKPRPEEKQAGGDYLGRLQAAGPRQDESLLTFAMRMAALARGREVFMHALLEAGSISQALKNLKLPVQNETAVLRRLGMTKEEAHKLVGGKG